jgi:transposase
MSQKLLGGSCFDIRKKLKRPNLRFFQLKQRFLYNAYETGKVVFLVPEHYTTKTCSSCGTSNNNVGNKEIFSCNNCSLCTGRDMNASKNMILNGLQPSRIIKFSERQNRIEEHKYFSL